MRVAVTGGAGFIGRATCLELERAGHEPVVIDRHHGPRLDVAADQSRLEDAMRGCQAVIHLAGELGTSELFEDHSLDRAIDVNCKGFAHVLQCCETLEMQLVAITVPDVWRNVYQATKRFQHDLALAWMKHRGLKVSFVRAYNVFGEGQKVRPVRKIIPTWATAGWRGEPIEVWGDGRQIVDLVHVNDVAKVLVDALRVGKGEVLEAGTSWGHIVFDVAMTVLELTGNESEIVHKPMRAGETPGTILVADTSKNRELGLWEPKWRPDLLAETVLWYKADRP